MRELQEHQKSIYEPKEISQKSLRESRELWLKIGKALAGISPRAMRMFLDLVESKRRLIRKKNNL